MASFGLPGPSKIGMSTSGITNRMTIDARITPPWRIDLTHLPKVTAKANGIITTSHESMMLVKGFGFS